MRGSTFIAGNSLRQSNLQKQLWEDSEEDDPNEGKKGGASEAQTLHPSLTRWQVSFQTTLVHLHTLFATCAHKPHGRALVATNKLPTLGNNNTTWWMPRTTKPKTTEPWPKTREPCMAYVVVVPHRFPQIIVKSVYVYFRKFI